MHRRKHLAAVLRSVASRLCGAAMPLMVGLSILATGAHRSVGAEEETCAKNDGWVSEQGLRSVDRGSGHPCRIEVATVTATPVFRTKSAANLPGSGDLRAAEVVALEFDARTSRSDPGGCGLPFTLVLRSDGGTPTRPGDDDFVYHWDSYLGLLIAPCVGEGWLHFRFEIPSDDTSVLPDGWTGGHPDDPLSFRSGVNWNDVITNVDRVEVWWGVPSAENSPRDWIVAIDEIEFRFAFDSPEPESVVDRGALE